MRRHHEHNEIVVHLLQIRSDVSEMKGMLSDYEDLKETVGQHDKELLKAKATFKIVRWVTWVTIVVIPATVAAFMKIFNRT